MSTELPVAGSISVVLPDDIALRIAQEVAAQLAENVPRWMPDKPLTIEETCAWFGGINPSTLRRWEKAGVLRPFRYGQTVLYMPDAIMRFVANHAGDEGDTTVGRNIFDIITTQ